MENKVLVLMSTYNGERYLEEQLDSLINQNGAAVSCFIRDDGSTDSTRKILDRYSRQYANIKCVYGDNVGYKESFNRLIYSADDSYDYYAFCDQDDIWEANKVGQAIMGINRLPQQCPALYYSNLNVVDADLNDVGMLFSDNLNTTSWKKQMFRSKCYGCTMLINHAGRDMVLKHKSDGVYAHDYWIPLLIFLTGNVYYDNNAYIKYRQHDNNLCGAKRSLLPMIRLYKKNNPPDIYLSRVKSLLLYKGDIEDNIYKELYDISLYKTSVRKRMNMICDKEIRRDTLRGTILLKIRIILGLF